MFRRIAAFVTLLSTLLTTAAQDVVEIADGSRVAGQLQRIEAGVVTIETAFAGTLEIPQEQVVGLETDQEAFVEFADGTRIRGQMDSEGDNLSVSGSIQATAKLADVQALWQVGEPSPRAREQAEELEQLQRKWVYEVAAGMSGKTGNSEALGVAFSGNAVLEGKDDRLHFYGRYRYSEVDDQKEQDDARGGVDYRNEFYDKVFWYLRAELGRDDVRDLDLYTQTTGGLGYQLIDREKQTLAFLGGLAHRFESYVTGRNESFPALDLNLEHDYDFGWAELYNDVGLTVSLSDMNQYELLHESGIEVPLGTSRSWSLRAGVENEYDGAPEPGNKRLDTTYFTNVVYTFE